MHRMIDALNHDTDFQTLIKKYESPNCFNIMGRTRREEWHSNFVCWLLDPSSNHNLGNFPLKMFFELINENPNNEIDIDEIDFDQTIFKTEVSIENGRIDILGESEKIILIIENKLDANETYNAKEKKYQTDVYFKYFDEKEDYKKKQKYYVYLRTKSGNRPSNKNFIPITYQKLFDEVIFKCIHCENITDETRFVLEQYAISISNPNSEGTHMAYTEKIIAEKLYEKHESVIERIRSTMNDTNRDEKSDICVFFEKYQRYLNEILGAINKRFITKRTESSLSNRIGNGFLKILCDKEIVIPDKTELIFEKKDLESHILFRLVWKKDNTIVKLDTIKVNIREKNLYKLSKMSKKVLIRLIQLIRLPKKLKFPTRKRSGEKLVKMMERLQGNLK